MFLFLYPSGDYESFWFRRGQVSDHVNGNNPEHLYSRIFLRKRRSFQVNRG